MKPKVILFCALLFCSKFVASIPFDEQQRAFHSSSHQGNQNIAEQYHGPDLARGHSVNSMNNSAQQYPTAQEYKVNREDRHTKNYDFNDHPPSLPSLPARSNPVNFALGTNENRPDGFVLLGDSYPIRNQHRPIRMGNQFKQQNWPYHNRFQNSGASAVDNAATIHKRPLTLQKPYHNSGQPIQLPPVNRQHYQGDNLYKIPKDFHYHPVPQESGSLRYVANTGTNSETHTGPMQYKNYPEVHAHNTNIAKSGHNAYVENVPAFSGPSNVHIFENYNRPASKTLNGPGSYILPLKTNNNNNVHAAPINTGLNNFNNRFMENPIAPSAPHKPPISSRHNEQPFNTYRNLENPIVNSGPNSHVLDVYHASVPQYSTVPHDAISDESVSTGYIHKPLNTYNVGPTIQNDSSNDGILPKFTNDDRAYDTAVDGNKPNIFHNHPEENPNEEVYNIAEGENVRGFFLNKKQKKIIIIYENGTVEYVNHLNTGNDSDYIAVENDKPILPSPPPTSNSAPGSKQSISNILDPLPDKTDYDMSTVTPNDNKRLVNVDDAYNSPLVSQPSNDNGDYDLSSLQQSQLNQDTTPSPLLESTGADENSSSGLLDDYDWNSEARGNRHRPRRPSNSNKDNGISESTSILQTHISATGTHTSTTPTPDDALIQAFLDSISNKSDKDQLLDDNHDYSPHDIITTDDSNNPPFSQIHTTVSPLKLHTVISPGIFRSTTSTPDNLLIQEHQDSRTLKIDTSSIPPPSEYDESLQDGTTPIPPNSDLDNNPKSTPVDQIITISPIELVTENVKDDSTPTPVDKGSLETDSVVAQVSNSYNTTTTSLPSYPDVLHNIKSVCNDSLANIDDPVKFDDNTADPTKQNGVNTGDTATGDNSLESKPPTSGIEIKLSLPKDSDGTIYIKVDAPDDYTGNEDTPSDETLFVTITKQNSSDTESMPAIDDTNGHDYFNKDQENSDESSLNKNLKLDLSNSLVIMNGTTDKDYLNQLLTSDSKVNLFIFQMPCQNQAIVEKLKETTIYPNGTCVEQLTETRWKNKDDPSPVMMTMKKIYEGGKCE